MPSRLTKIFAPLALAVLLLSSCAIQSPQARIERNPEIYKALTAKQKELVSQGQIAKGMPKPGVFLAMGHPDRRGRGFRDGRDYERWDFASLRPVYTTSFYGGYGYGRGCGRRGYGRYGVGYGPTIQYIPERSASVWFQKGRVEAWERVGIYP